MPLRWEPYYGLPIYIVIGLFLRWLVEKVSALAAGRG